MVKSHSGQARIARMCMNCWQHLTGSVVEGSLTGTKGQGDERAHPQCRSMGKLGSPVVAALTLGGQKPF